MRNFLTEAERDQLRSQHKKERDKRVCDRIKAVLLYDKGWTLMQIADTLLLTDEAIRQHVREYKDSRKLITENGGSVEKLSDEQCKELEKHLQEHTYLYLKDIAAYIEVVYKVSYTVPGLRHWMHRHGFSHKKPALVPHKANPEDQKQWIAMYEKFKTDLGPGETICFMDGVHPTHNTQLAYGWIKKGVRKEISCNSGRSRINLSGAIDVVFRKVHVHEDKTLNSESTISFFKKIEEAYPEMSRIHVFCDNARYYRNKDVDQYLKGSKIELHFLPPYSPNLNPIERLWKWMKERVMYNTYYSEFEDFKIAILGFLRSLSEIDPLSQLGLAFASRIRDKFSPIGTTLSNSSV